MQQQREADAIESLYDMKTRSMEVDSASPTNTADHDEYSGQEHARVQEYDYDYYSRQKYFVLHPRLCDARDPNLATAAVEMKELKVSVHLMSVTTADVEEQDNGDPGRIHDYKQIYLTCCCEEFKSSGGFAPAEDSPCANLHMIYPLAMVCRHTAYLYLRHYGYSQRVTHRLLKKALDVAFAIHMDFTSRKLRDAWSVVQRGGRGGTGTSTSTTSTIDAGAGTNIITAVHGRNTSRKSDSHWRCCICLEDGDDKIVTCNSCSQKVHQYCIDRWIGYQIHENLPTTQDKCPMCRGVFAR